MSHVAAGKLWLAWFGLYFLAFFTMMLISQLSVSPWWGIGGLAFISIFQWYLLRRNGLIETPTWVWRTFLALGVAAGLTAMLFDATGSDKMIYEALSLALGRRPLPWFDLDVRMIVPPSVFAEEMIVITLARILRGLSLGTVVGACLGLFQRSLWLPSSGLAKHWLIKNILGWGCGLALHTWIVNYFRFGPFFEPLLLAVLSWAFGIALFTGYFPVRERPLVVAAQS